MIYVIKDIHEKRKENLSKRKANARDVLFYE